MPVRTEYRLVAMYRAEVVVVMKPATRKNWKRITKQFLTLFPDGHTGTGRPTFFGRSSFWGAWRSTENGKTVLDWSEKFTVDYLPRQRREVHQKFSYFKEYLHGILEEEEIWLQTMIPLKRLLTPSSPGWPTKK